jgi:type I site-specific restriction endonuclease
LYHQYEDYGMSYEKIVSRNIETEDKDELESSLSQVISAPKRKRPAKIELAATLRKIRHLLAEGYTNREIIEMLNLEERTFYRYMKRIYAQDQAYFEKQDNESIATEIRLAKERTLKSLRRYDAIAADESLSAAERMEAERWWGDIVIALAKIELEGPRIMYETSRRLYDHQYGQKQKQQLDNGNIAAAFEPSRQ